MQTHQLDLHRFIQIVRMQDPEPHGAPPSPFNLRFKARRLDAELKSTITGTGIYLIAKDSEVVYLGKYQPKHGDIISDRWGRHLQTITGRGYDIGFGGQKNPENRLIKLLEAVCDDDLRVSLGSALIHERRRFKDTGYNTTANRLRFASENWKSFQNADDMILDRLSFTLIKMDRTPDQAASKEAISVVEQKLLEQFHPLCNAQYKDPVHGELRPSNTLEAVIEAVSALMRNTSGRGTLDCVTLMGGRDQSLGFLFRERPVEILEHVQAATSNVRIQP